MGRTVKLSDLQLTVLTTAAQNVGGSLLPLPASLADQAVRIRKAVPALMKRGLLDEADVAESARAWRKDGDRHVSAVITGTGRDAIGIAAPAKPEPEPPVIIAPGVPSSSKIARVLTMMKRETGATLPELVAATGWQPHTTRAALTGLRRKGHQLDKRKRGEITCYHVAA